MIPSICKKFIFSSLLALALVFVFFGARPAEADIVNSAVFTSAVKDLGGASVSLTFSWSATIATGTTAVTMQVRSGTTAVPTSDSDANWTTWTTATNGASLASPLKDNRYFQYRATLTSTDINQVPALNDVTIGSSAIPATSSLISSPYDSGSDANLVPRISWNGSGTSTAAGLKFQIRSAASTSSLAVAPWCGFADTGDACSGNNYFDDSQNGKQITDTNHPLLHGGNDRYFQYQVIFTSAGQTAATLNDVTLTYVVNAPPEFATAPTASQSAVDGKVRLDYAALDPDTAASGVNCPNCVVASLRYSLDNGSSWTTIPSQYLSTPAGANLGFGTSTIATASTSYAVIWDAKSNINGVFATSTKLEVTLNDKEGGNNTVIAATPAFTLDVANPALGSPSAVIDAKNAVKNDANHPALLTLNASDQTADNFQMCVTLDNTQTNCHLYNATSSIMIATDPDVVYVKFVDKYQNVTATSVQTPETPTRLIIKDVSDQTLGIYQEFLAWKAIAPPPQGTFADYKIEYSTDGSTYQDLKAINDISVNYYFHQSLVSQQKYYYRVYSLDSLGNASYYSTIINDVADGSSGASTNPPIISNVKALSISTQSAAIEWETDALSDSNVAYADSTSSATSTIGSKTMVDDASDIGKHHVVLTGLLPNHTYYYTVQSSNILGVSGTDTNGGAYYNFTTLSGPTISGTTVSSVTNNSATIIWNTSDASDSTVYFSTSTSASSFDSRTAAASVINHTVTLTNLAKGTVYYYYVKSGVGLDNNGGNYYTFSTPIDNIPPVIDAVTSSVAIDSKALITWTTSEPADAKVDYGLQSGTYSFSKTDSSLGLDHFLLLSDLASSTQYYYKVTSADASGNVATSSEHTFNTSEPLSTESAVLVREAKAKAAGEAAATTTSSVCPTYSGGGGTVTVYKDIDRSKPLISEVKVDGLTGDGATVSWTSDRKGSSFVKFWAAINDDKTVGVFDSGLTHKIALTGLKASTKYFFNALTSDEFGNLGTSAENNFTTGDAIGLPDATSTADNQDAVFTAAMDKVSAYLITASGQVSVNTLEAKLNDQYDLIRQLSATVPVPLLAGEPRVLVTARTATITWTSDKAANSLVAFSPEANYDPTKGEAAYRQVAGDAESQVKNHAVTIFDLQPDTIYHYQVRSETGIGSLGQSGDFVFKTSSDKLEITNYVVQNIGPQTATFKWLTNNETNSTVKYTPYRNGILAVDAGKTVEDKNYSVLHEVAINDFESGVVYDIELSGQDIKGQVISKEIIVFSTGQDNLAPIISQVQTESALSTGGKDSNVQTVISWLTNENATAQVLYQKGAGAVQDDAWQKTPLDGNYAKKHIVVLTKFEPGQIYQFKIQSSDSSNNLAASGIYTVLAPKQKESVFEVIIKNFEDIFGWIK